MKAIVCTRYGPREVLQIADVKPPTPTPNEVCVRIVATAVTSSDCAIRGLKFPFVYRRLARPARPARPARLARLALGLIAPRRRILGLVLAGAVASVGREVGSCKAGDAVFGIDRRVFGAYAEQVCWPQDTALAQRPVNLTYEEAAAIPCGGLLALHYLRQAEIQSAQRALM